uniref:Uncharacterized protein n=1 Tax=Romanomermis culicivorax TaxID=13658 RepID=A0A915IVC6_ROMCU
MQCVSSACSESKSLKTLFERVLWGNTQRKECEDANYDDHQRCVNEKFRCWSKQMCSGDNHV